MFFTVDQTVNNFLVVLARMVRTWKQGLFLMVLEAVKTGLAQSVHNVFVLSLGIILFGLVAVFFLKEIPLKERRSS